MKDYYQSLDVPTHATANEIKAAYRRRALACHPDRGGTHAAMLDINEAFEILSDPEKRSMYDRACRDGTDAAANKNVTGWATQAEQNARNYPREWNEFKVWVDALTADLQRATYGRTKDGLPLPTAGDSISGWIFIGGGVIGGYSFFTLFCSSASANWVGRLFFVCIIGGAWIGRWFHELVGRSCRRPSETGPDANVLRQGIQTIIPADKLPEVIVCLRSGRKAAAVKICRETLGLSLAEALAEIERLQEAYFS